MCPWDRSWAASFGSDRRYDKTAVFIDRTHGSYARMIDRLELDSRLAIGQCFDRAAARKDDLSADRNGRRALCFLAGAAAAQDGDENQRSYHGGIHSSHERLL